MSDPTLEGLPNALKNDEVQRAWAYPSMVDCPALLSEGGKCPGY